MHHNRRHTIGAERVRSVLEGGQSAPLLTEEEIANLLFWTAGYFSTVECPTGDTMCEECEPSHRLWWDLSNSLSGIVRVRLHRFMREEGIPFPHHPGDDIAVPTAQR